MTLREYRNGFIHRLSRVVGIDEATGIFNIVLQNLTGMSRAALAISDPVVSAEDHAQWEKVLERLLAHEPVQYVLGEAWFFSRRFSVNPNVLIPRPETEELVQWIIDQARDSDTMLDIGTGSGCIAITLALETRAMVTALDVSAASLDVARQNAVDLGAKVNFLQADILKHEPEGKFDVIVSNPPYVRVMEKVEIKPNVLRHEPHLALFVSDDDALLFYRRITSLAMECLKPGGWLYFEINQYLGPETVALMKAMGFADVQLRQDLLGNDRMVRAIRT